MGLAAWWIKEVLANSFIFPVTESLSPMQWSQSGFSSENLKKINNKSLTLERWNAESCFPRFRTCVPLSLIISHLLHKSLSSLFQEYSRWGLKKRKFWWTVQHESNSSGQAHWNLMLTYLIGMGFYLAPNNLKQTWNCCQKSTVNVQLIECIETARKWWMYF